MKDKIKYADLEDLVLSGEFDSSLKKLRSAVNSRLETVRKMQTTEDFFIGDTVVFNELCTTQYLNGQHGTVTGRGKTRVKVRLKHPVGYHAEFANGEWVPAEIAVLPSVIDSIG